MVAGLALACVVLALLSVTLGPSSEAPPPGSENTEYLYLKASAAFHGGDFEQAIQQFEVLRRELPDDPRVVIALGDSYLNVGRMKEAREAFERAVQLDPKRGRSWSRLGVLRVQAGDVAGARQALEKALTLNARDNDALEQLAELETMDGRIDQAVKGFLRAAESAPQSQRAELVVRAADVLAAAERSDEAIALLRAEREKRGERLTGAEVPLLQVLGELELRTGALEAASRTYREAAIAAKRDATLWVVLGEILTRLGKPQDAEQALRQSLQIEDRALTHVALGRLALARGDRAGAESELEAAAAALSGTAELEMVEVAELLIALGRKADALRVLSSVASEDALQGNVELQRRTARLAQELGNRELAEIACVRVQAADGGSCP